MKGIILAGGSGTRLYPITRAVSKQILPLFDKPMIYYPLSVLMLAEIRDILVISTPRDIGLFKELFGNGAWLGMNFSYKTQEKPGGLAEAFIIGEDFIGGESCSLVLGDNVFFGRGFSSTLKETKNRIESERGAAIFGYYVKDPGAYGVVEFEKDRQAPSKAFYSKVISIEEKPASPKSRYAVPGLYFYDNDVINIAKSIKPSARGELEITAVNNAYLEKGRLSVEILGRGMAWLDTGTYESLLEAANFIETIQKRQGMYVSCIEEIAYSNGWISRDALLKLADGYKTEYGEYLRYIAANNA